MPSTRIKTNAVDMAEKLERFPAELQNALQLGLNDTADAILADSQERVPVDRATLKKSGSVHYGTLAATVGYYTPYAWYVHEGTGLYGYRKDYIYPRTKRFLSWEDRRTGKRIFAKKVKGMPAVPYLFDAIETIRPFIPKIFLSRFHEAWEKVVHGGAG